MASSVPRPQVWAVYVLAALLGTATYTVLAQSQPAPARPAAPGVAGNGRPRANRKRGRCACCSLGAKRRRIRRRRSSGRLSSTLARRGIQLIDVPTAAEAFAVGRLAHYDALMVFGDLTFTADQQKALAAFVDNGKGVLADSQSVARRTGRFGASCRATARDSRHRRRLSRRRIRS